jgi:predicted nucleic acid-binding protein
VAVCFFDSSGIAKRYVTETGSVWVDALVDPGAGNQIHLASITGPEVVSAITRRQRAGSISAADATRLIADFRHDFANAYSLVDITPTLIAHAMTLAEAHALRGYDAVQLAAALQVHARCLALKLPFLLISADTALNAAAKAEGLPVDDPNNHP